jgi:hypothetical protein
LKTFELPYETKAATGYTHKIVLDHTDLTTAADNTAQTITLITLPADTIVKDAATHLVTSFQLTGTTAYNSNTIQVGVSGTTDQLIASQQINTNGTPVTSRRFAADNPIGYTASTPIIATVASMASYDLLELNAGEIHIFLAVVDLNKL